MPKNNTERFDRRKLLHSLVGGSFLLPAFGQTEETVKELSSQESNDQNALLWAMAWQETAAEFGALCHQAFNLAHSKVKQALSKNKSIEKPLAIITDLDNTIMHATSYWGYLINQNKDFFDDAIWDKWIPKNLITSVPGAKEFLDYCYAKNVEVFYVTNRDQGEKTYEYALNQLRHLDFPYADNKHLTVYRETSNKMPTKKSVSQSHELILMLGDNLNDFKRDYYVKDIEVRYELMERDKNDFGEKFILLPNPTDGHWVRAIFGTSEPKSTSKNREILKATASRNAWDGK